MLFTVTLLIPGKSSLYPEVKNATGLSFGLWTIEMYLADIYVQYNRKRVRKK